MEQAEGFRTQVLSLRDRTWRVLACALACGAKIIVSRDKDLLVLDKPFGIEILPPRQFVARLAKRAIRR